MQIQTGIITISDRASKGLYDDLGGPALKKAAEGYGWKVVAEKLEQAADNVQSRDPGMILHDVERAARRRPEIFFGGMFLAGLVLSRFLKASSERDDSYNAETSDDYWVENAHEVDSSYDMPPADQPVEEPYAATNDWRESQPGSNIQPGGSN